MIIFNYTSQRTGGSVLENKNMSAKPEIICFSIEKEK